MQQLAKELLVSLSWANLPETADSQQSAITAQLDERLETEHCEDRRRLLETLGKVLSLWLDPGDAANCPFGPPYLTQSLDQECLSALAGASEVALTPAIRARIVDVAWSCGRVTTPDRVRAAIAAYFEHAHATLEPHWTHHQIRRAVLLVTDIAHRKPEHLDALEKVAALVRAAHAAGSVVVTLGLMQLLQAQRDSRCASEFALLAGQLAEQAKGDPNVDHIVRILLIQERWYRIAKEPESARNSRERVAHTLSAHTERLANQGEIMMAVHFQEEVIKAWRRVQKARDKTKDAQVRLQELQRRLPETFGSYQETINLESCALASQARVSNKDLRGALQALASFPGPASRIELESKARTALDSSVFYKFVSRSYVSDAGRTVTRGGVDVESEVTHEARRSLSFHHNIIGIGSIIPAARQIQSEHGLTAVDLLPLVVHNPFVPVGREMSFARGIALGFQGHFDLSAHLLMPQFENALRTILEARGAVVTSLPASGEQNEFNMGQLFELPECAKFLGDDKLRA